MSRAVVADWGTAAAAKKQVASGRIIRFAEHHGRRRKYTADALGVIPSRDAGRLCGARTGRRTPAAGGLSAQRSSGGQKGDRGRRKDRRPDPHPARDRRHPRIAARPERRPPDDLLIENSIVPFGTAIALSLMMLCAIRAQAPAIYVGYQRDDAEENAGYARPAMDRLELLAAINRGPGAENHRAVPAA